jgi:hypothetical protein
MARTPRHEPSSAILPGMVSAISQRFTVLREITQRRWVRILLVVWALSGIYDLALSEWIPESVSSHLPRVYQVVAMTAGLVPWMVWLLAGAVIIVAGSVEYAFRHKQQFLQSVGYTTQKKPGSKWMWPLIGMILGGLCFIGCAAWLVVDVRSTNDQIENALRRYVLPRHLTDQQISTIADYLRKFGPQVVKFTVAKDNQEANSYRADIQKALEQSGWAISSTDYADIPEGVRYQYMQTQENNQKPRDAKNPRPDTLITDAFKLAHVRLDGGGGGSSINVTADSFTIFVGHRRMDDGDLIGKRIMRERALRQLQDLDDGD